MKRYCPNCLRKITGHKNKKFCNSRCKDRYHNLKNPRGIFAHLKDQPIDYENDHPFSSEALGQW